MSTTLRKTIQGIKSFIGLGFLLHLSACQTLVTPIAGDFHNDIEKAKSKLSSGATQLIDQAFEGINLGCFRDFHIHSVGIGKGQSGAWVNPNMQSWWHPTSFLKYNVYMSASGIENTDQADQQYAKRLMQLLRSDGRYGKALLFAFDYHYTRDGKKVEDKSTFYIPNDYVMQAAARYPQHIIPVASVHPYRSDALKELERLGKLGVRYIKWLPNAQHIDPYDARLDDFYATMYHFGMTLISHTGHEKAVEGEEFQQLGNPLRLRRPLSKGVKVIMAHMASLGDCEDFDNGNKKVFCFELYKRMLEQEKWKGRLFGEFSAITIYTRVGRPLDWLIENPQIHDRFVHGSDYPLPAINILYRTGQYHELGYITDEERIHLNEIYRYNPILFDFVSKRTLKHPQTRQKLSAAAFEYPAELGCQEKANRKR